MTGMHARFVQRGEYLAGKAVIGHAGNRSLDPSFAKSHQMQTMWERHKAGSA
jgi:hypothetical protein